jgi:hypothetical protein
VFLSAAAAFSAASFLFACSASVYNLSSYPITFGIASNSSLFTADLLMFKIYSSVSYFSRFKASYGV